MSEDMGVMLIDATIIEDHLPEITDRQLVAILHWIKRDMLENYGARDGRFRAADKLTKHYRDKTGGFWVWRPTHAVITDD